MVMQTCIGSIYPQTVVDLSLIIFCDQCGKYNLKLEGGQLHTDNGQPFFHLFVINFENDSIGGNVQND